jgi:competence protein ComEC
MTPDIFASRLNELLPEPHASLAVGMLFGIRSSMPRNFYDALIATGTVHMIALSGMNVSILVRLLFEGVGRYFSKWIRLIITFCGIIFFVILVGGGPTIIRASIMGSLTILAAMIGRKAIPIISLTIASIIMTLFNPQVLTDISFQLSFFATLGIILFASEKYTINEPIHAQRNDSFLFYTTRALKTDLKVTLSAQVFTLPIIFWYFERISLIAPLANVAVGWLVGPIMYLSIIIIAASFIFKPIAYLLCLLLWVPLTIFIHLVTLLSKVPVASISLQ